MTDKIGRFGTILWVALLAAGLAACDEGATGPDGTATATVQMNRLGSGSASLAVAYFSADARLAKVDLDSVAAIHVSVDSVQLHRIGDGDGEGEGDGPSAGWYGVSVTEADLDLMALPVDQTLTIASGIVPAGSYNQLRLFVTGATVDFAEGYDPDGEGGSLEPGATGVPLDIPSAEQTGIKVSGLSFLLEADGEDEVTVTFDGGASVKNLTVTGNGQVKMSPVLKLGGGATAGT